MNFYIYSILTHEIVPNIKKDLLGYEFLQGTYFTYDQPTTPRFHIQVLVLIKIALFQEKVTTTSVPI